MTTVGIGSSTVPPAFVAVRSARRYRITTADTRSFRADGSAQSMRARASDRATMLANSGKRPKGGFMSTVRRYTRTDMINAMRAAEERGKSDTKRHTCFLSYHIDDAEAVVDFLASFGSVIIPRVLGVTDEDLLVDNERPDYTMRRIREEYLTDSTVTIVIGGQCTWARKYVDWEIASSLRDDANNARSGLLVYAPKGEKTMKLPARVQDNWVSNNPVKSYVEHWMYPVTENEVRGHVELAFQARTNKASLVDNTRTLRRANATCPA
jgi:hypothetical protein